MLAALSSILQFGGSKHPVPKPFTVKTSPKAIAEAWLKEFASALTACPKHLGSVLHEHSFWRDMLVFSWDLRTLKGLSYIIEYHVLHSKNVGMHNLKLQETGKFSPSEQSPIEGVIWIESMFSFETTVGYGKGMIHLMQDIDGKWKGAIIYTALQSLRDFPGFTGAN